MREVARLRNLLSGFVTTLKQLFESVIGTLFCLLLYLSSTSVQAGSVAALAEERKRGKYCVLKNTRIFQPFAVEIMGYFGPESLKFLKIWRRELFSLFS